MHVAQRRLETRTLQNMTVIRGTWDPLLNAIRPGICRISPVHTFALQLVLRWNMCKQRQIYSVDNRNDLYISNDKSIRKYSGSDQIAY